MMTDEASDANEQALVSEAGERRSSILSNMTSLMSSQVVSWVLGTVAYIVQPRYLGPEGLGQLRLAWSVWLIGSVFWTLGTSSYLTLEYARNRARGASLVGPIMNLRIAGFVLVSTVIVIYLIATGADGMTWLVFSVAGTTLLLQSIADTIMAALTGMERMAYPAITGAIAKVVYTITMVVVLSLGGGVVGCALTNAFNAALVLVLLAVFYRRLARVSFRTGLVGYRTIVRSSAVFMLAGAIIIIYLQVDTVVMSALVEERALGWYSTADFLGTSLMFVPTIMMAALFPVISRLHVTDSDAAAAIIRRASSVLFLAGIGIGFGTFVVAEPFSVLLFGDQFRESGVVLMVFGLAMPLLFGTVLLGTVATAIDRQRFWIRLMVVAVVMSIALDLVLVPWTDEIVGNGALGGALAYIVTELFMVTIGAKAITPEVFKGESLIRLLKALVAGGLMVIAAWPLREHFLPIPIGVGAVTFAGAVYLFSILTDEDLDMIRRAARRVGVGTADPELPATLPSTGSVVVASDTREPR